MQRQVPRQLDISGEASVSSAVLVNGTLVNSQTDPTNFRELVSNPQPPPADIPGQYYNRRIGVAASATPSAINVTIEAIPGAPASTSTHFVPAATEAFAYDADGNLTQDGTFMYEWDGENRLKAVTTRGDIAAFTKFFRLEFAYDYLGRRIAKRYRAFDGDPGELLTTPAGDIRSWTNSWEQRFIWDSGATGGYGNLSASFLVDPNDGTYLGADQSYAWGPDMSGTENGAGGIGGLAIASLAANDLSISASTYVPLYDGHGNVISLRNNSAQELDWVAADFA